MAVGRRGFCMGPKRKTWLDNSGSRRVWVLNRHKWWGGSNPSSSLWGHQWCAVNRRCVILVMWRAAEVAYWSAAYLGNAGCIFICLKCLNVFNQCNLSRQTWYLLGVSGYSVRSYFCFVALCVALPPRHRCCRLLSGNGMSQTMYCLPRAPINLFLSPGKQKCISSKIQTRM